MTGQFQALENALPAVIRAGYGIHAPWHQNSQKQRFQNEIALFLYKYWQYVPASPLPQLDFC